MAPRATAIGKPIMPVPGMPTPIAFFRMLGLSFKSIFSGRHPSASVAFATQSATAIGSVHPTAGITSLLTSSMIRFLSLCSIVNRFSVTYTLSFPSQGIRCTCLRLYRMSSFLKADCLHCQEARRTAEYLRRTYIPGNSSTCHR